MILCIEIVVVSAVADSKDSAPAPIPSAERKSGPGMAPVRIGGSTPGQGLGLGQGLGQGQSLGITPSPHEPRTWHTPSDHFHRLMMHEHIANILRELYPHPLMYQFVQHTSQEINNDLYFSANDFHEYTNVPALPALVCHYESHLQ